MILYINCDATPDETLPRLSNETISGCEQKLCGRVPVGTESFYNVENWLHNVVSRRQLWL